MSTRQPTGRSIRLLKVTEQDVFLAIQKTAGALMTELADLFKPHGISPTQYNVLRILRGAGAGCGGSGRPDPGAGGLTCREIGERMLTHDPDMTRLLDRLEARGLIGRERSSDDRRRVTSRITAAGLDVLKTLDRPLLDLHRRQLGHLAEKRLGELLALLEGVQERCS